MAVYVDPIFHWPGPRGYNHWSHMGTDLPGPEGLDELHRMAKRIGMRTPIDCASCPALQGIGLREIGESPHRVICRSHKPARRSECWFQHDDPTHPHYDITPSRRKLAVAAGAIELPDTRVYSRVCHQPHWAAHIRKLLASDTLSPDRRAQLESALQSNGIWGDDDDCEQSKAPVQGSLNFGD